MTSTRRLLVTEETSLPAALEALRRPAGMLVLPTETLYGLSGRAADAASVERLVTAKRRSRNRSFVAIAGNLQTIQPYLAADTPSTTIRWLQETWPAPLSAILRVNQPLIWGRSGVDSGWTAAFRIPSHPWLLELAAQLGEPILSTSVNRSGAAPLLRATAIVAEFGTEVDLLVEDPVLESLAEERVASTLVDATQWPPRVVRSGAWQETIDEHGYHGGWDG